LFNANEQPETLAIEYCEGKYTRISKLVLNGVMALKLNIYCEFVDLA
jgi:hypothetical protein